MLQRVGVDVASSDVSNRFEELLVNPTLLTLATQRGDLDCAGLRHLIIGYGYFNAYVLPILGGHGASPSRSIRTPWRAATPFDRPSSAIWRRSAVCRGRRALVPLGGMAPRDR